MDIVFWNLHGFKNFYELWDDLQDPVIICVSEIWLTVDTGIPCCLNNYSMLSSLATKPKQISMYLFNVYFPPLYELKYILESLLEFLQMSIDEIWDICNALIVIGGDFNSRVGSRDDLFEKGTEGTNQC